MLINGVRVDGHTGRRIFQQRWKFFLQPSLKTREYKPAGKLLVTRRRNLLDHRPPQTYFGRRRTGHGWNALRNSSSSVVHDPEIRIWWNPANRERENMVFSFSIRYTYANLVRPTLSSMYVTFYFGGNRRVIRTVYYYLTLSQFDSIAFSWNRQKVQMKWTIKMYSRVSLY
jgi:hypothetical protein